MATAGRPGGLVIAALDDIGREAVDDAVLAQLRRTMKSKYLLSLAADARYAPAWIADILRKLSASEGGASHG